MSHDAHTHAVPAPPGSTDGDTASDGGGSVGSRGRRRRRAASAGSDEAAGAVREAVPVFARSASERRDTENAGALDGSGAKARSQSRPGSRSGPGAQPTSDRRGAPVRLDALPGVRSHSSGGVLGARLKFTPLPVRTHDNSVRSTKSDGASTTNRSPHHRRSSSGDPGASHSAANGVGSPPARRLSRRRSMTPPPGGRYSDSQRGSRGTDDGVALNSSSARRRVSIGKRRGTAPVKPPMPSQGSSGSSIITMGTSGHTSLTGSGSMAGNSSRSGVTGSGSTIATGPSGSGRSGGSGRSHASTRSAPVSSANGVVLGRGAARSTGPGTGHGPSGPGLAVLGLVGSPAIGAAVAPVRRAGSTGVAAGIASPPGPARDSVRSSASAGSRRSTHSQASGIAGLVMPPPVSLPPRQPPRPPGSGSPLHRDSGSARGGRYSSGSKSGGDNSSPGGSDVGMDVGSTRSGSSTHSRRLSLDPGHYRLGHSRSASVGDDSSELSSQVSSVVGVDTVTGMDEMLHTWHYVRAIADYEAEDAEEISLRTGEIIRVQSNDLTGWLEGELVKASPGRHRAGWFPSTFVVLCTKTGEPIDANAAEPKRRPRKEPNYPVIDTHHGSLASIGVPFHAVETLEEAKEVWEATRTVDPEVARVAVTEPRPDEVDNPFALVVFDYEPTDHSELQLFFGDLICVDATDMCGWLQGRIMRTDGWESGWFPSNFVVNCDRRGRPLEELPDGVDEVELKKAMRGGGSSKALRTGPLATGSIRGIVPVSGGVARAPSAASSPINGGSQRHLQQQQQRAHDRESQPGDEQGLKVSPVASGGGGAGASGSRKPLTNAERRQSYGAPPAMAVPADAPPPRPASAAVPKHGRQPSAGANSVVSKGSAPTGLSPVVLAFPLHLFPDSARSGSVGADVGPGPASSSETDTPATSASAAAAPSTAASSAAASVQGATTVPQSDDSLPRAVSSARLTAALGAAAARRGSPRELGRGGSGRSMGRGGQSGPASPSRAHRTGSQRSMERTSSAGSRLLRLGLEEGQGRSSPGVAASPRRISDATAGAGADMLASLFGEHGRLSAVSPRGDGGGAAADDGGDVVPPMVHIERPLGPSFAVDLNERRRTSVAAANLAALAMRHASEAQMQAGDAAGGRGVTKPPSVISLTDVFMVGDRRGGTPGARRGMDGRRMSGISAISELSGVTGISGGTMGAPRPHRVGLGRRPYPSSGANVALQVMYRAQSSILLDFKPGDRDGSPAHRQPHNHHGTPPDGSLAEEPIMEIASARRPSLSSRAASMVHYSASDGAAARPRSADATSLRRIQSSARWRQRVPVVQYHSRRAMPSPRSYTARSARSAASADSPSSPATSTSPRSPQADASPAYRSDRIMALTPQGGAAHPAGSSGRGSARSNDTAPSMGLLSVHSSFSSAGLGMASSQMLGLGASATGSGRHAAGLTGSSVDGSARSGHGVSWSAAGGAGGSTAAGSTDSNRPAQGSERSGSGSNSGSNSGSGSGRTGGHLSSTRSRGGVGPGSEGSGRSGDKVAAISQADAAIMRSNGSSDRLVPQARRGHHSSVSASEQQRRAFRKRLTVPGSSTNDESPCGGSVVSGQGPVTPVAMHARPPDEAPPPHEGSLRSIGSLTSVRSFGHSTGGNTHATDLELDADGRVMHMRGVGVHGQLAGSDEAPGGGGDGTVPASGSGRLGAGAGPAVGAGAGANASGRHGSGRGSRSGSVHGAVDDDDDVDEGPFSARLLRSMTSSGGWMSEDDEEGLPAGRLPNGPDELTEVWGMDDATPTHRRRDGGGAGAGAGDDGAGVGGRASSSASGSASDAGHADGGMGNGQHKGKSKAKKTKKKQKKKKKSRFSWLGGLRRSKASSTSTSMGGGDSGDGSRRSSSRRHSHGSAVSPEEVTAARGMAVSLPPQPAQGVAAAGGGVRQQGGRRKSKLLTMATRLLRFGL